MSETTTQTRIHCSQCGRDLDRWYYGNPLPLCARCADIGKWTTCPRCGWQVRQDPPGSGILGVHGGRNWIPCPESGKRSEAPLVVAVDRTGEDRQQ